MEDFSCLHRDPREWLTAISTAQRTGTDDDDDDDDDVSRSLENFLQGDSREML
jgi:hypothetical protein